MKAPLSKDRRSWRLLVCLALATIVQPSARGDDGALQKGVAGLVAGFQKKTPAAAVGVSIVDLKSGAVLADVRANELFIPASNQKLLTSAFALARHGGDDHFTTTVYAAGKDLVVVGDFDPTLGDPRLAEEAGKSIYEEMDRWAAAIRQHVGPRFEGDIVICTEGKAGAYRNSDWPVKQFGDWYAAPAAEVNFNNNCFDVTFTITGGTIVPSVSPASRLIQVVNNVKSGKKQTWGAVSNEDDSVLILKGTLVKPSNDPVYVACNNPPMLFGRTLAERIMRAGVEFGGKVRPAEKKSLDLSKATVIAQTTTPLATAMARANKRSLNMVAECIFLHAGDGTWPGSAALMTKTLTETFGLPDKSLVVQDGSGLSRSNLVSPAAMTTLLSGMLKRADAGVLLASLPIGGTDGTMQRRLDEGAYKGRVLAKTGYITGVSCLSGYVLGADKKPVVAFSVMANKVPGAAGAKDLENRICQLVVDSLK
ncbi:MAG: D-alanyl-D-alanine carboxypeptidase/D-alanyl-D-alanine-endopeptidase [Phycisphaerae bacterium]|jgi:D-alanyl-D-alanine carboxypeptidase/D-alanyl-D-alanine-endopeptidase (penicillin-binding protein 4)